jgi:outer membrane protein OmpA-like peptidoglycan-associated protein
LSKKEKKLTSVIFQGRKGAVRMETSARRAYAVFLGIVCLIVPCASQTDEGQQNPTMTRYATRGLTLTNSAETMGSGRLSFALSGTWFEQKTGYPHTANTGTQIYTTLGSFSFGVNSYMDVFASGAIYALQKYSSTPSSGIGSVLAGIQGTLPLPSGSPFHLGAQGIVIAGTSGNQIDSNRADGYNYFETRTGYDFIGKFLQSLIFGTEARSVKLHFNEGAAFSLEKDKKTFLLLGMGLQGNLHPLVAIGLEFNSRSTFEDNAAFNTDPLWLTPSIHIRTPYYMNFVFGADLSISQERTDTSVVRSLEQYRIFGGLDFTFDLLSGTRKAQREKERKAALEKEEMGKNHAQLKAHADSLALKMREDSLAMVKKMREDSIAAEQQRMLEKRRADSLALKAVKDSIALAETKRRLQMEEELSKRSDAEKQLLATGMITLEGVSFESGRTELTMNARVYLMNLGKALAKYPKLMIEIGGHTDNMGRYDANRRLSYNRAEAVRQCLIAAAPELATRLNSVGYGPDRPKEDNRSAAGRKANRRIELQVQNKDVLKEYNP